eukprot:gb/GECH01005912.1/.p1 GENE.gb/GECH01005912.1/~~gb/GECH01005912.1/.p1  ORF type:complete len:302 (+),score=66.23 gb/GECH01005912.1/:1-906(+)
MLRTSCTKASLTASNGAWRQQPSLHLPSKGHISSRPWTPTTRVSTSNVLNSSHHRSLHTSRPLFSGEPDLKHRNKPWNNKHTPFDFTQENYKKIYKILRKFPPNRKLSGVLPLLHMAQIQKGGWIPLSAMNKIADILEVDPMRIYEVCTFYSMFNREPIGKYHLQVCVTTPCMIRGSDEIMSAIEKHLGIELGETTEDKMFTLGEMECMGACVNAPMIAVADYRDPDNYSYNYYEDLTEDRTIEIIEMLRRGETPPTGSQSGRQNCRASHAKTSLTEEPKPPPCRDISAIREELEKQEQNK